MSIADEEAFYKSNKAAIVQRYMGRWIVVKDGAVAGDYGTYEDALAAAVARFGASGGFMVKQVMEQDPVQRVGRVTYGY